MKLKKLIVTGLYEAFDHEINFDNEEQITIIIGQNGLGKTVILQVIKSFFDRSFDYFKNIVYSTITFQFQDEVHVVISRIILEERPQFKIEYFDNGKLHKEIYESLSPAIKQKRRASLMAYEDYIHFDGGRLDVNLINYLQDNLPPNRYMYSGDGYWVEIGSKMLFSSENLLDRYFGPGSRRRLIEHSLPKWLLDITDSLKTKMIETQRLLQRKSGENQYTNTVQEFSNSLAEKIKTIRAASTDLASRLDRTFPKRLLEYINKTGETTTEKLSQSLQDLEKMRDFLNSVGLIDSEEDYYQPYLGNISESIVNVLTLYITDSNAKLEIYKTLAEKLHVFLTIINKRFLYKTFKIEKGTGFVFSSTVTGKAIPLSSLSSGEQHELVLFYQLIFNTDPNSLLLIDEPEISLHISWQQQFINDLKEIIKVNPMGIVIATHSPDIIGKYMELATTLQGFKPKTR